MQHVNYIQNAERQEEEAAEREKVHKMLQAQMMPFIRHAAVEQWLKQYTREEYGKHFRFRLLLLRGRSRAGKTVFARKLFGDSATIVVNCQGLQHNVPSLRHFERNKHKAIVFDEVTHEQILMNKALFQAGVDAVELSQSNCGGFRYSIWPYQVAMICCSNWFPLTKTSIG